MTLEVCLYILSWPTKCLQAIKSKWEGGDYLSVYLDNGNIMFWLQLSDVVLELDNNFDQVHDGFVDSVIGTVELGCGCSLDRI